MRACTPDDKNAITNALKTLEKADVQLLDASLVDVQTKTEKAASAQSAELSAANTDFSKELETLNQKISDSAPYRPVLDPYVKHKIDMLTGYKNIAVSKQMTLSKDTTNNIDNANKSAEGAAKTVYLVKGQIATTRSELQGISDDCSNNIVGRLTSNANTALKNAGLALDLAKAAPADVAKAAQNIGVLKKLTKALTDYTNTFQTIDPPISTIGQSVQFILIYTGNVTPTWTFVAFKGPNNPLFSASGTRTHMLNITLGSPTAPSSNPNPAIAQNQLYLLLNNRLPGIVQ